MGAEEDAAADAPDDHPRSRWKTALLWVVALVAVTAGAAALTRNTHSAESTAAAPPAGTTSETRSELSAPLPAPIDIDGDGTSDPAVDHDGDAWVLGSTAGTVVEPGPGDDAVLAPGDYDGDGRTDLAAVVKRKDALVWALGGPEAQTLGRVGDQPVPGDYNGDGRTEPAVARAQGKDLQWIIGTATARPITFGLANDQPVPADYDGDGHTDLAVRRGTRWYVLRSSDGEVRVTPFGLRGDLVAPGDFTGDRVADIAVVREDDGQWVWYVQPSDGSAPTATPFGRAGRNAQVPITGDFDGDGKVEPAVADLKAKQFFHLTPDPDDLGPIAWGGPRDQPLSRLDT